MPVDAAGELTCARGHSHREQRRQPLEPELKRFPQELARICKLQPCEVLLDVEEDSADELLALRGDQRDLDPVAFAELVLTAGVEEVDLAGHGGVARGRAENGLMGPVRSIYVCANTRGAADKK